MLDLTRKQRERFLYLEALYKLVESSPIRTTHRDKVAAKADLTPESAKAAFYYLLNENLIKAENYHGEVSITHKGVKEYETALLKSRRELSPLEKSSVTNILNITDRVEESQINFVNQGENMEFSFDTYKKELLELIAHIKEDLPSSKLGESDKRAISAEIKTIEEELEAKSPKKNLIQGAVHNLKAALTSSIFDTSLRLLLSRLTKIN